MSTIVLRAAAIDELMRDAQIQLWLKNKVCRETPFLGYYFRSYWTSTDGIITERGDGFSLATIDPKDAKQTRGLVIKPVIVIGEFAILVGGEEATMSRSFSIGWSNKFTYEPLTSA